MPSISFRHQSHLKFLLSLAPGAQQKRCTKRLQPLQVIFSKIPSSNLPNLQTSQLYSKFVPEESIFNSSKLILKGTFIICIHIDLTFPLTTKYYQIHIFTIIRDTKMDIFYIIDKDFISNIKHNKVSLLSFASYISHSIIIYEFFTLFLKILIH